MGGNNWFFTEMNHIPKGLFAYMTYVNHHAQFVHALNYFFPKIS